LAAFEKGTGIKVRAVYDSEATKTTGRVNCLIATARKFLGIIYQTLKNDWIFEDFPTFVIANT